MATLALIGLIASATIGVCGFAAALKSAVWLFHRLHGVPPP